MAQGKLFEYVILHHPKAKKDEQSKSTIVQDVKRGSFLLCAIGSHGTVDCAHTTHTARWVDFPEFDLIPSSTVSLL
jgi:hypothetical protein